mgnify:FL=1
MKFKTSITVPAAMVVLWEQHSANVIRHIGSHLSRYRATQARRDRLTRYTDRGSECVVCNVYWEIEVYNQLHAVSSRLRISVSHLLLQILAFILQGGIVTHIFTSYAFSYRVSEKQTGIFSEMMTYSSRKKRRTEEIT